MVQKDMPALEQRGYKATLTSFVFGYLFLFFCSKIIYHVLAKPIRLLCHLHLKTLLIENDFMSKNRVMTFVCKLKYKKKKNNNLRYSSISHERKWNHK